MKFNRRDFIKSVSLASCLWGLGCERRQSKPNFIIIFTDDQGYGDLSCYGSTTIRTPNIDEMAKQGMRFTSFYVGGAVCTPSRAALMTGCYPQRVGLSKVMFPNSRMRDEFDGPAKGLNASEKTIAEICKSAGYRTGIIGKWHLGSKPEFLPTRHGFDYYFGLPYSNDMHPGNEKWDFPPLPLMVNEKVIETNPDQDHLTSRYTKKAIEFIEQNVHRPFFLYLAHSMPHRPVHASEAFTKRFTNEQLASIRGEDKASRDFLYPAAIEEIDWSTGKILAALDKQGLTQNTLIIFTSDNGPAVGSAGPLRGGKGSMYEGGMRVPCIMRWPDKIPAGSVNDEIVTAMDIAPTFAALAGASLPENRIIDGKNMTDLLVNKTTHSPHDTFYYLKQDKGLFAIRYRDWKLFFRHSDQDPLIPVTLYHLKTDLGEKHNVINQHPMIVKHLEGLAKTFNQQLDKTKRKPGVLV